jgi:broad-specificity NMP kinase
MGRAGGKRCNAGTSPIARPILLPRRDAGEVAVGVRNYLIEGVSGAGKTTVAEALQRRGCHVVHGDRELAYHGNPETGEPASGPAVGTALDETTWRHQYWIWNVDKVRSLVGDQSRPQTFFCGGSRNHRRYIHLFDEVFVLEVDLDTLQRRVRGRADDEFGAKPDEWAMLARLHATREDVPKRAVSVDATQPVDRIVDEILSHCRAGNPDAT